LRQGPDRRNLHLFVDGGSPHIQGSPENKGKPQHIVDLIGKVTPSRGHDDIGTGGHGHVIGNLRIWIGHGHHDGLRSHAQNHLRGHNVSGRKTQKDIGTDHGFRQGIHLAVGDKLHFHFIEVGAPAVKRSLAVYHHHIAGMNPECEIQPDAGNGRGTGTTDHYPDLPGLLPHQREGIQQGCRRYNGRPMLVVMKNRDIQFLL